MHYCFTSDEVAILVRRRGVGLSDYSISTAGSDLLAARSDLWNGNISHMVTCLPKASDYATNQTITPEAFGSAYKYDQLNRLSSSRVFTNMTSSQKIALF